MKHLAVLAAMIFCLAAPAQDLLGGGTAAPAAQVTATAAVHGNRLEVTYAIPAGQHMTLQKDLVFIEPKPVSGLEFGATVYPVVAEKDEEGAMVYRDSVTIFRELRAAAPVPAGTVLEFTVGWQVCLDTGTCFSPETIEMKATLPAALSPAGAPSGTPAVPDAGRVARAPVVASTVVHGLGYFMLLAFLGGLLLNLMPCVLPVLSIKMLGIVKSAHDDARTIRNGALAYTAGVLVSFVALAAVVIALKAAGAAVGWGFQFQNPVFVMALLVVVWVFALSLFDLFMIRAPGMQAASAASAKRGLAGSFFSGVFAVLLATPCTAPMLGAALGFAFAQSAPVILLSFLLVVLGLALPFLLAGFFPRATRFVPKPGAWMNTFREVMGFLLLATPITLSSSCR
jgi:thiol:disulfide interchange protein DsbD